jgi:hypothetical protein
MGMLDLMSVGRHRASALSRRFFPAIRRHLQHLHSTADTSVPSSPKSIPRAPPPPPCLGSICEYTVAKKHIGLAERDVLVMVCGNYDFQSPPYMACR